MTEFNRLNQQKNARPYFLVIIFSICLLFPHALVEYSSFWISNDDEMNFGLQIQERLSSHIQGSLQDRDGHSLGQVGNKDHRTVVIYTGPTSLDRATGKNELYLRNFEYFLDHKGVDCSQHDAIVTLSEETYDYYVKYTTLKNLIEECGSSLKVVKRQDFCYDLGSIHLVLSTFDLSQYEYFVYLNCGVVGPLWWNTPGVSWTTFFTSMLSDQIKMSGLSTNCHNRDGYQAHIQSMAFALDRTGLKVIQDSGAIYDCGMGNDAMTLADQRDLIGRYELGMTRAIFAEGYSISSWLWSRGLNSTKSHGRQVHEPVVMHGPDHRCYDVWYVEPFLKISSNFPRHFPSWNMTFFKTSRFIPPDVFSEVEYELTNDAMKNLVDLWYSGLASRFWAFQMSQSAFVE